MNVEIFKESEYHLSVAEAKIIIPVMQAYYEDKANGYLAFALNLKSRDQAFDLVDALNDLGESCWNVGDEDEEYVFIN